MKKTSLLLATAASVILAQSAFAADIPAKAPIYKAAPMAAWDWTGPYLGVYAGIAASRSRSLDPSGPQINDGVLQHTGYGFTGGGTIGYNW